MRVKNEIIRILEKEFSISNLKQLIDDDDSMSFLNISSIQFINLVVELEAFFNIEFDDEFLSFDKFLLRVYVNILKVKLFD